MSEAVACYEIIEWLYKINVYILEMWRNLLELKKQLEKIGHDKYSIKQLILTYVIG